MKKAGVLSLQGDFAAHGAALERAGAEPVYVREAAQLDEIDGLVLPGGESTTMLKLLHYEKLYDAVAAFGRRKPVFGTCAGAILLASEVTAPEQAIGAKSKDHRQEDRRLLRDGGDRRRDPGEDVRSERIAAEEPRADRDDD